MAGNRSATRVRRSSGRAGPEAEGVRDNVEQNCGSDHRHRAPPFVSVARQCQKRVVDVHRINAGTVRRHGDPCRTVHRCAGSHRAPARARRPWHRLCDGGGRIRRTDHRHARRLARSSTHLLSGAPLGSWVRWRLLVLDCGWRSGDLRSDRRRVVAATGTDGKRAAAHPSWAGAHRRRAGAGGRRQSRRVHHR